MQHLVRYLTHSSLARMTTCTQWRITPPEKHKHRPPSVERQGQANSLPQIVYHEIFTKQNKRICQIFLFQINFDK